eukprot:MONOS_11170.1-p1 / transcript=MONOS_11170.1 / gene=MONOS_11170 / organism=Monocercomonoides_exilis_PA203 / gene_product=unspecified product / transcript_product=unspecified product / location=Mono_scaffold00546:10904-13300(+) / protein_length=799 / sequence_SO=supercontig / SO=protein_coding / is_pseudo=false
MKENISFPSPISASSSPSSSSLSSSSSPLSMQSSHSTSSHFTSDPSLPLHTPHFLSPFPSAHFAFPPTASDKYTRTMKTVSSQQPFRRLLHFSFVNRTTNTLITPSLDLPELAVFLSNQKNQRKTRRMSEKEWIKQQLHAEPKTPTATRTTTVTPTTTQTAVFKGLHTDPRPKRGTAFVSSAVQSHSMPFNPDRVVNPAAGTAKVQASSVLSAVSALSAAPVRTLTMSEASSLRQAKMSPLSTPPPMNRSKEWFGGDGQKEKMEKDLPFSRQRRQDYMKLHFAWLSEGKEGKEKEKEDAKVKKSKKKKKINQTNKEDQLHTQSSNSGSLPVKSPAQTKLSDFENETIEENAFPNKKQKAKKKKKKKKNTTKKPKRIEDILNEALLLSVAFPDYFVPPVYSSSQQKPISRIQSSLTIFRSTNSATEGSTHSDTSAFSSSNAPYSSAHSSGQLSLSSSSSSTTAAAASSSPSPFSPSSCPSFSISPFSRNSPVISHCAIRYPPFLLVHTLHSVTVSVVRGSLARNLWETREKYKVWFKQQKSMLKRKMLIERLQRKREKEIRKRREKQEMRKVGKKESDENENENENADAVSSSSSSISSSSSSALLHPTHKSKSRKVKTCDSADSTSQQSFSSCSSPPSSLSSPFVFIRSHNPLPSANLTNLYNFTNSSDYNSYQAEGDWAEQATGAYRSQKLAKQMKEEEAARLKREERMRRKAKTSQSENERESENDTVSLNMDTFSGEISATSDKSRGEKNCEERVTMLCELSCVYDGCMATPEAVLTNQLLVEYLLRKRGGACLR